MKKLFLLYLIVLSIMLYGCYTRLPLYYGTYNFELTQVERPAEASKRYGEIKISPVDDKGVTKYSFDDNLVNVVWLVTNDDISFVLENKTDYSMKIIWDDAAFVDSKGQSQRVMHSGVKYTDRNNSQPPSVIVRKGKITDIVQPVDLVYLDYYWFTHPMFNDYIRNGNEQTVTDMLKSNVGKQIQVLLPLKIEETVNDYIFTFTVKGYTYIGEK